MNYLQEVEKLQEKDRILRDVVRSIKWKSIDNDNMEFQATITYTQMDNIRKGLALSG